MKAIVAKVEKFLDAAQATLDPPRTYMTGFLPPAEGWTREAAKVQAAEWEAGLLAGKVINVCRCPGAREVRCTTSSISPTGTTRTRCR
jgi:hypothetical protein